MNTYILHDVKTSPTKLAKFIALLEKRLGTTVFAPFLPYIHPAFSVADTFERIVDKVDFPANSLIVGVGMGGLLAAKIQETIARPYRVVAIAAPTLTEGLRLEKKRDDCLALYSSKDMLVWPNTDWANFASADFEYTPLLFHEIDDNRYALSAIIQAWLENNTAALSEYITGRKSPEPVL